MTAPFTGESAGMPTGRDIVAIGASAGGIQVLLRLFEALPDDFGAAVLITVHIGSRQSLLPQILNRSGPLTADFGKHGEVVRRGRIYMAPPDQHMLVTDGHIELSSGPRENHFRPAIDPLFRTVARAYGDRVVGVVLSGALTDGTVGLAAIKAHGGLTIVQDPVEALVTGMPASALAGGEIDLVLTSTEMISRLPALVGPGSMRPAPPRPASVAEPPKQEAIQQSLHEQAEDLRQGELTPFTCPDCGGSLWQADEDGVMRFQCHVGHGMSWEALLELKSDEIESALWTTSRLFVERAILQRQIATRLQRRGADPAHEQQLRVLSQADEHRSRDVQAMLTGLSLVESQHGMLESQMDHRADRLASTHTARGAS